MRTERAFEGSFGDDGIVRCELRVTSLELRVKSSKLETSSSKLKPEQRSYEGF